MFSSSTQRTAAAARSTAPAIASASSSWNLPSTYSWARTPGGGAPMPMRSRGNPVPPTAWMMERMPLCPASLPRLVGGWLPAAAPFRRRLPAGSTTAAEPGQQVFNSFAAVVHGRCEVWPVPPGDRRSTRLPARPWGGAHSPGLQSGWPAGPVPASRCCGGCRRSGVRGCPARR